MLARSDASSMGVTLSKSTETREAPPLTRIAAPLLFASGFCALVYQLVWTRELRLIFGASTAASSAVIAIFSAGLGFGGLWFGRRVDQSHNALRLYARLELAIGALSALTPWLLDAVRALYVWSGGSLRLGAVGSNALRLVLASCVLLPPTWLMGGTLPAIARAIESEEDCDRRAVASVYAANTLGALLGCALCTFLLIEAFGNRGSLHIACALNLLIGAVAYLVAGRGARAPKARGPDASAALPLSAAQRAPIWLALGSAVVTGFAFFLMELVWYRMLGPLLGGSVFTFGIILCVALAGIGAGSALYVALGAARPRMLIAFALSCAAEAVCIALPFALGDRIALAALFLQAFATLGFYGLVLGWFAIAICVVFPAALLSGLQFPMLIALLGTGRTDVGRQVGNVYAANTSGAIAGALAGGFGLLPAIGALGSWRAAALVLAGWSLVVMAVALRSGPNEASTERPRRLLGALCVIALALSCVMLLRADGPSAVFRHSPIGVGRVPLNQFDGPNSVTAFLMQERRSVDWQTDGVESAIAITHYDGVSFIVNGKSDGSALSDAATQVMGGLLGAALLPHVKRALVIGLGTGSTAGWLASLPEIERVDVAEIEPAISQVARRCAAVNRNALSNPKLHVLYGDARELLSVLRDDYDVIFSEPSNPYRAGVASMYAREFYAAVQRRLSRNGLFIQWLQAYDIDATSVSTIYGTLASVFAHVETWHGLRDDLLLVASGRELVHDVEALRARITQEPFASALRLAWDTESLEGFLGHYVANDDFTRAVSAAHPQLDTDEVSPVEFGFARTARGGARFSTQSISAEAQTRETERPMLHGGAVDWARVDYETQVFALITGAATSPERLTPSYQNRLAMLAKWLNADFTGALNLFNMMGTLQPGVQLNTIERLARAEMLAYDGSIESEREIERLLRDQPTEATALHAVYLLRHARRAAGSALLIDALRRYRGDPWAHPWIMLRMLSNLQVEQDSDRELVPRWLTALAPAFALRVNESARDRTRLRLAYLLGPSHAACVALFESFEPYPPWSESMLQFRAACYEAHAHPLRERADDDLRRFRNDAPSELGSLLQR
jgi:spermidine synthase